MIPTAILQKEAQTLGVPLSDAALERFGRYAALLVDWNTRMNLTAITDPEAIVIKHFLDSLTLLAALPLEAGTSLIDVGTGAGFPGLALKIARPDLELTLLDATRKKLQFLEAVLADIGLEARCVHARAEAAGRDAAHRERYAVAVARAVAPLWKLGEYVLPLVKVGGWFVAMKGPEGPAEGEEAAPSIARLGGEMAFQKAFTLVDGSQRTLIGVKKISQTSLKYPRPAAKIAKLSPFESR